MNKHLENAKKKKENRTKLCKQCKMPKETQNFVHYVGISKLV
jgi:hypothetical protein